MRNIYIFLSILLLTLPRMVFAEGRLIFYGMDPVISIKDPRGHNLKSENNLSGNLLITGTYSRAEDYGIDGIAIIDGILKSKEPQSWGGILLLHNGLAQIFPTTDVMLYDTSYDLTASNELYSFIEAAKENRVSVIQSHLLIKNSALDLREVKNAPKFIRRILFTKNDGEIGVWQSSTALTLFEATSELLHAQHPIMAINLDMGAYDFCRQWTGKDVKTCGDPSAGFAALTNLIEINPMVN